MHLAVAYNGFESKKVIDFFVAYAETVMKRYKGLVKYYLTFNEINAVGHNGYNAGGLIRDNAATRAQAGTINS